jgi:uncharacterized protein YkwD
MTSTDKLVYTIKTNGNVEYMVVPYGYSFDTLASTYNVLNADGTAYFAKSNYYEVTTTPPYKKISTDKILSWQDSSARTYYMLVPSSYDKVRAETAKARATGEYLYYTVYASKPVKSTSSDIIIDYWNDNADDYRYILVPKTYNESRVDKLMEDDISSTVITTAEANVNDVISAINSERKSSGLSALVIDASLSDAAKVRAEEIADKYSHKRPDGTSYKTALDEAGASYKYSEEMIFKNMKYSSDVVDELFADEDYRDSLLSSVNKRIGVAYNSDRNCYVVIVTD